MELGIKIEEIGERRGKVGNGWDRNKLNGGRREEK